MRHNPLLETAFEKAKHSILMSEDIEPLSTNVRCTLIGRIVHYLTHTKKPVLPYRTEYSLQNLGNSFDISDNYFAFCAERQKRLLVKLREPRNRFVLDIARHWERASRPAREAALETSAALHQRVYLEGIADTLPFRYVFLNSPYRRFGMSLSITFGSFSGDMRTGRGTIKQAAHRDVGFDDPVEAFDTAHHEVTHGLHFALGYARNRNRLLPSSPLYNDAAYFEALSTRNATVPTRFREAYEAQTHEYLARREGGQISHAILELARA